MSGESRLLSILVILVDDFAEESLDFVQLTAQLLNFATEVLHLSLPAVAAGMFRVIPARVLPPFLRPVAKLANHIFGFLPEAIRFIVQAGGLKVFGCQLQVAHAPL
ncbi:MAG: hypothetical protein VX988_07280 [Planctomycetota bacterium]|nr:hypothetical protein [Planctomycetota bacterium]